MISALVRTAEVLLVLSVNVYFARVAFHAQTSLDGDGAQNYITIAFLFSLGATLLIRKVSTKLRSTKTVTDNNKDVPRALEGVLPLDDAGREDYYQKKRVASSLIITTACFLVFGHVGSVLPFMVVIVLAFLATDLWLNRRSTQDPINLFFRSFSEDKRASKAFSALKNIVGEKKDQRLAAVYDPSVTIPRVLRYMIFGWVLLLDYANRRYFSDLHASKSAIEGDDSNPDSTKYWAKRIHRTLLEARRAFLYVEGATDNLKLEIELCTEVLGAERLFFVVDDLNAWKGNPENMFINVSDLEKTGLIAGLSDRNRFDEKVALFLTRT